jgi:glutamate racemase
MGGRSVANAIEQALPQHEVIFSHDVEHMPYGDRDPVALLQLAAPHFEWLVEQGCSTIVVACNTVSTTIIEQLRALFDVPIIGVEPLLKLAAEITENDIITVCATPTTLASERYKILKETYAKDITVLEPDCSAWARLIEHDAIDEAHIRDTITEGLAQGSDVIVLGCTHYHWIEEQILSVANHTVTIVQPEPLVIEELKQVLAQLG